MKKIEAISILRSLAKGLDPFTGERLANDNPLHNADVARALFYVLSEFDSYEFTNDIAFHIDDPVKSERKAMLEEYDDCRIDISEQYVSYEESYDYQETINDIMQEAQQYNDNYARSEEDGWFYSDDNS